MPLRTASHCQVLHRADKSWPSLDQPHVTKECHEEHRAPNWCNVTSSMYSIPKVMILKEPATFSAKFSLPQLTAQPTRLATAALHLWPLLSAEALTSLPSHRGPTTPPDFLMTHQLVNRCRRLGLVASSEMPGENWRCSSRDHTVVRTAKKDLRASDKTSHLNRCFQPCARCSLLAPAFAP